MEETIDEFEKYLGGPTRQTTPSESWGRYGLLRNPFPARAYPIWDVLHNQEQVKTRFLEELGQFVQSGETTTLFFTGGNRVGKTHSMHHYQQQLPSALAPRGLIVPIIIASAQSGDFRELYIQIIERIDDSIERQTQRGLFQTHEDHRSTQQIESARKILPRGDFREAVVAYLSAKTDSRSHISDLLRRWLRTERLRAPQRAMLHARENIDSLGAMLNALEGLVRYLLEHYGSSNQFRLPGILIFLDEFELLWKLRRDRRDQYLQNLRALLDACPKVSSSASEWRPGSV